MQNKKASVKYLIKEKTNGFNRECLSFSSRLFKQRALKFDSAARYLLSHSFYIKKNLANVL